MKYFTIAELCKSDTADRLGIDNRCKKEHVANMTALVDNVLDLSLIHISFIQVINYNSDDSYLTSIGGGSIQIVDLFGHLISLGLSSSRPFKISKEKKGIELSLIHI